MIKSLLAGGLMVLSLGLGVTSAEAKTRVHIGVGIGNPYYYECENPGYIDFCGRGFYRGFYRPYYAPRYRYYGDDGYVTRRSCNSAARAIRTAGYRNIKATDCAGRHFGFTASKRGKVYKLRVDSATGRISLRR
jgi:hypothetical protein